MSRDPFCCNGSSECVGQPALEQAERGELLAHPLIDTDQVDVDQLDAGS